jgi:hypothetical protein
MSFNSDCLGCGPAPRSQTRAEAGDFEEGEEGAAGPADDGQELAAGKFPWSGTDREYDYEELLGKNAACMGVFVHYPQV